MSKSGQKSVTKVTLLCHFCVILDISVLAPVFTVFAVFASLGLISPRIGTSPRWNSPRGGGVFDKPLELPGQCKGGLRRVWARDWSFINFTGFAERAGFAGPMPKTRGLLAKTGSENGLKS